ncbi:3555_t:CDS:2 [Diversispora eburnea]|uniref:3555_t:CDS:1 n=1 Tax=Diversispora eburnea TaxID=1213867 RepID=A0A9N8VLC9_9GLOM|nr:3555_t:CDS:2 [Diversispora eburnea]
MSKNTELKDDYEAKLDKANEEIEKLKRRNRVLAEINKQFGEENDQLNKDLDQYKKYRMPRPFQARSSPDNSRSIEMKLIMKKIDDEFNLNYDETFAILVNLEIQRKLIPELISTNPDEPQLKCAILVKFQKIFNVYMSTIGLMMNHPGGSQLSFAKISNDDDDLTSKSAYDTEIDQLEGEYEKGGSNLS